MIYDITLPMKAGLAGWPGDVAYHMERETSLGQGGTVNLSSIIMSVHTGSHVDAPFHFLDQGATIEELDLLTFLGPALLIDVSGRHVIQRTDLDADFSKTSRLLLRTNAWNDHTQFPVSIPVLAEDVPAYLAQKGIILLGLDVPSVDALDSKDLPIHCALAAHGITILESLDLKEVPEGHYELIALPLRLVGADASPVRALLKGDAL